MLFEVRSKSLKGQPGEICFPGGGVEERDKNYQETAVRETSEELGIPAADVEVWGALDVLVMPSKMIIYPFVGKLGKFENVFPNKKEVEEVFTVPLEFLLNAKPDYYEIVLKPEPPADFPYEKIPGGRNYSWREGKLPEYFYEYQGRTIWGITARILTNFLAVIKKDLSK